MPRFEISDVRGETRDVVAPVAPTDLTALTQAAQKAIDDAAAAAALASQAQTTATAAQGAIPVPATATPAAEKTSAAVGAAMKYAREDHAHPRLTSTNYATLDANGQATVTFTRTFTNKPGLNLTETDATSGSQPLVLRGLSWVQDGSGAYTGVTIQGRRAQMLPTINPLSGALTLLSGVITGVNTLVAALTNYNVFGGSAAGAVISVIAVARSDVA